MKYQTVLGILEAMAVGDALGMPTEFMDRIEIERRFVFVGRLLPPLLDTGDEGGLTGLCRTDLAQGPRRD